MAKSVNKSSLFENLTPTTDTHEHTDVYTPTHTHTPKVRERKTSRLQILTYESLTKRLDEYAKSQGLSRAEVFEMAVNEFLERNT
jgi:hypothetical protein